MARVEYLMSSTMSRDALAVAAAEEALRQPARAPLARAAVRRVLGAMQLGRLRMSADGQTVDYGRAAEGFPDVHVTVHDERFYSAVAFGGSVGAGESYMNGWWSTDDLLGVVRLFVINEDALASIDSGWAKLAAPLYRLGRFFSRNTRRGSKRNIAAHYDLSNDFFSLWLDPSMMYSAAIFERDAMTLEEAQASRLALICDRLRLSREDHLLEIGTGWGGLAITAARDFGCKVTTTTISREQAAYARAAVARAGLTDRVSVVEHDYRELPRVYGEGAFNKLVSVEMIEAVGADHLGDYASICSRMLRRDGLALIQAILIGDHRYADALRTPDFIQKHIFPGSFIPSMAAIMGACGKHTDLTLADFQSFGDGYARTLREWRSRFHAKLPEVRALGFDDRFIRMWEYYLCYCEGGFAERRITVGHLLLRKPGERGPLPTRVGS